MGQTIRSTLKTMFCRYFVLISDLPHADSALALALAAIHKPLAPLAAARTSEGVAVAIAKIDRKKGHCKTMTVLLGAAYNTIQHAKC